MERPFKDIAFVSLQFLLLFIFLFRISAIDFAVPHLIRYTGLAVSAAGFFIIILSILKLHKSLSAFPTPRHTAELIDIGVYRYVRHPIYTGILAMTLGWSLYSGCTLRLLVFGALLILFYFKARYEESLLLQKFAGYAAYQKRSGMFLPGL
ncbi:MAG: isoprenylcysteine carboxylmethyltransferase family protein [Bacteroidetes bacterium]|nr:isoprenylcysteine carboxylmethyltransferase family protein [Bacteroidota bacterium]